MSCAYGRLRGREGPADGGHGAAVVAVQHGHVVALPQHARDARRHARLAAGGALADYLGMDVILLPLFKHWLHYSI